ncbi:MAG: cohesin domain-containing protein, partial [Candidatus Marinimicrobia bacterium]|nr:cohesin domain-containing protein [Candidatus Neomarinimicrobiota bacterium]
VADVSWNGSVTAFDAAYILQYAVGLIQGFPAEELYKNTTLSTLADAGIFLEDSQGNAGRTVKVPLTLNRIGDLHAFQIRLSYDASVLTAVQVDPATTLDEFQVFTQIDAEAGEIRLAAAGSAALSEDGIIANIVYELNADVEGEQVTPITITQFLANDADLTHGAVAAEVTILGLPTEYALQPAYPNPFNPSTTFNYSLPVEADHLRITVHDLLGREVQVLYNGPANAGRHSATWSGQDLNGKPAGNGIYFIGLMTNNFRATQKITMIR